MVAGLALVWPGPVLADAIEDLVVTARKRAESLQDVPISITAFSGEQMRARGIANNYDLAYCTPNFNTVKQVGRRLDRSVIRGMAAPSTRGEPNASYFIDGVFVSNSVSTATVEAVERTEILRGPQSAQFGRATFAGAVNFDDGATGTTGVTLSNGNTANMWTLNPQRGRDWGLEFQYRFRAW
jgi:outer membrane receptor protein involved in Fe transport